MGSAVLGRSQLARLFQIYLAVSGDRPPNARELAERCEVSRRTIYRDLETLMLAGVPVEFRQELRGYRIAPGTSARPPTLGLNELQALLVLIESWAGKDTLGLLPSARAGLQALLTRFSPATREAAQTLQRRIGEPSRTPSRSAARATVDETILIALGRDLPLELSPASEEQPVIVRPRRLVNRAGRWTLVVKKNDSEKSESIAVDEIQRASLIKVPESIPESSETDTTAAKDLEAAVRVVIRVSVGNADYFRSGAAWPLAVVSSSTQCEELSFDVETLDEAVSGLIACVDLVEVLEPVGLRECLRDIGERVARYHARTPEHRLEEFQDGAVAG